VVGECNTRPENVQEVVDLIKSECEKMRTNGITEEELDRFKHWRLAKDLLDSSPETLAFVTRARLYCDNVDAVNAFNDHFARLTVKEVNAAASEIFCPEKMIAVDCGKSADKKGGDK
jgi:predicted Zn-dependent peptidase